MQELLTMKKQKIIGLLISSIVAITAVLTSTQATSNQSFSLYNPETNIWINTEDEFNAITVEFLDDQDSVELQFQRNGEKYLMARKAEHQHSDEEHYLEEEINKELESEFSQILYLPETYQQFYLESTGKVNISFYNTTRYKKPFFASAKSIGGLKIISRAEWGADESVRYSYSSEIPSSSGSLTSKQTQCQAQINAFPEEYTYDRVVRSENGYALLWPRQYSKKIKKIIVHHTAESEKSSSVSGGDKIRSIYYYHAKTRGWGDIGYNFLIDQDGKIYEGRAGGDYVVGGHAFCNNINTIGISLMGNFQVKKPSKAQIQALSNLSQALANKYRLDISKQNVFHGKKDHSLIGHQDVRATACPGDNLYKLLPLIRKNFSFSSLNFSINANSLTPASQFGATLSGRPSKISMQAMSSKNITLTYKNTGKVTWKAGTWLYAPDNRETHLWADPLLIDKTYVVANLREQTVVPGDYGHFDLTLNTGISKGTHTLEVVPIINGERKLNLAAVLLAVEVNKTDFDYHFLSAKSPENPFYYGQQKTAEVSLLNTGNTTWYRSGNFPITLDVPNDKESRFASPVAPKTLAWLEEESVPPGRTGTFYFEIYAGFEEGNFELPFIPRIAEDRYLKDLGMKFSMQVKKPDYQAQILFDEKEYKFKPGEKRNIRIGLRNLSNTYWQADQISLRVIRRNGISFQQNAFIFPENTPINQAQYIDITVSAPLKPGKYQAKLQALANNKKFANARYMYLPITVTSGILEGKITHISDNKLKMSQGEEKEIVMRIKNTGNVSWLGRGPNSIRLETIATKSSLKSRAWKGENIVALLEETEVEPGKVASFKFKIRMNADHPTQEVFLLRSKGLGTIQGSKFILEISDNDGKSIRAISGREELLRRKRELLKNSKKELVTPPQEQDEYQIPSEKSEGNIRVLLSFPESSANVLSDNKAKVYYDGKEIGTLNRGDSFWIRKDGNKLKTSLNNAKAHANVVRITSSNSYLKLNNWLRTPSWNPHIFDNTFEETLEFRIDDGKMIVINDLGLEKYLKGMAEVPEAQADEKRKAMAILARSYAKHYLETEYRKFPGKSYDASDSPAVFQKYLGYNYSLRSPKWQSALKATDREVIVYNNEILRTAYFSCSNGRTKTPDQASWTNKYYKKVASVYESVADLKGRNIKSYNAGRCGHGVGLSGQGAQKMAEDGKSYKEIIHYYYQNVSIEKR